jgi:hypothetical protein
MTEVSKEIRYVGPDGRLTYEGMALLQAIAAAAAAGGGGGGGATDLGYTAATRILTSSTGTDVTLPLVGANPGLMSAADKAKLDAVPAIATGLATVTVPNNALSHSETVTATGVTGASRIFLTVAPHDDADENDAEMLDIAAMSAAPGTNQITVEMAFTTPTAGPIKINWMAA